MNVLLDSSNFHEEWAFERFSKFIDQTTQITLPDRTISRLIELDMMELINAFEGIIMGWSAGASMQSAKYYIAPDKYYKTYSRHIGLNHINDFAVQVHYSGATEQIESMRKFIKDTGLRVYTLERNSAVIVKDDQLELIGNAKESIG